MTGDPSTTAGGLDVAILIYEGVTATDAIGPFEPLSMLPGATIRFVAREPGIKRTNNGFLGMAADFSLEDIRRTDILVVPGGDFGEILADEAVLSWIRDIHETTMWTTSVCSGALLLGAAGLLQGRRATSHWGVVDVVESMGATFVHDRYVVDGKVLTSSGNSAGIDMALFLAGQIAGDDTAQEIQLLMEYAPEPPYNSGTLATAPAHVREAALERANAARAVEDERRAAATA